MDFMGKTGDWARWLSAAGRLFRATRLTRAIFAWRRASAQLSTLRYETKLSAIVAFAESWVWLIGFWGVLGVVELIAPGAQKESIVPWFAVQTWISICACLLAWMGQRLGLSVRRMWWIDANNHEADECWMAWIEKSAFELKGLRQKEEACSIALAVDAAKISQPAGRRL